MSHVTEEGSTHPAPTSALIVDDMGLQRKLLDVLTARGLADVGIDYFHFLQLTTFDSDGGHTEDDGWYAYRLDTVGNVVGVRSGPRAQAIRDAGDAAGVDGAHALAAQHQRDAAIDLPTTAAQLVVWLFRQRGDIQLALPDSDDLPDTADEWIDAVATLAEPLGTAEDDATPRSEGAPMSAADAGRRGGNSRNAANKKVKEEAIRLYQTGEFGITKDAAAEALVPRLRMSFSTIRGWLRGIDQPVR